MKICQENLSQLTFVENKGMWRTENWHYFEIKTCDFCGEHHLARVQKRNNGRFSYCNRECFLKCPKQRAKQGKSLSAAWDDPEKRKTMEPHLKKAIEAAKEKRRGEVSLLDKSKKTCSKCKKEMPIENFTADKRLILGKAASCKYCQSKQYKSWIRKDGNKAKRYAYMRDKCIREPKFKLRMRISNAIYQSLVGDKGGRTWESLVGYTLAELKRHLERQFQPGMSWGNYNHSGWHIDHIVPISAHNFTKPEHEDFKRCWSLKNLQPLWAHDNQTKCAKIEKHFQPMLQM